MLLIIGAQFVSQTQYPNTTKGYTNIKLIIQETFKSIPFCIPFLN